MAIHTGPDGQQWMRQALQYARDHHQHTLVQETAQNPPFLVEMIQSYRTSKFEVNITAIGVAEAVSRQGIIRRYYEQRHTSGVGRLPPSEKVQASLRGVLDFAETTDIQHLAETVAVFRRDNPDPTYTNNLVRGNWHRKPAFRNAIEQERTRPFSDEEATDFLKTHQYLLNALQDDPGLRYELEIIGMMASRLLRTDLTQTA